MDVKTAHLNAPIVCELYIEQPESYGRKGPNGEKLVCRLKKFLSGLKQSGQNWNCLLRGYLTQEGFVQSQLIRVFMLKVLNFGQVIAIVWVDDIIIAGINTDVLKKTKESLIMRFKMKDLGVLSWFLLYPIQVWKWFYWNEPKQVCRTDSGKVQPVWLQAMQKQSHASWAQTKPVQSMKLNLKM